MAAGGGTCFSASELRRPGLLFLIYWNLGTSPKILGARRGLGRLEFTPVVAGRGRAAWFPWPTWDWSQAFARVAGDQDRRVSTPPLGQPAGSGAPSAHSRFALNYLVKDGRKKKRDIGP